MNKLLVPGVQIGIQMYFHSPNLILEQCECSWKIETRRGQSRNVTVLSNAQPQHLPRVDDENERQQSLGGLPDREKSN